MQTKENSYRGLRIFSGLLLAACAPAQSGSHILQAQWERWLTPSAGEPVYRLTVCPDGSFSITDGLGRLLLLDRTGNLTIDKASVPELRGTVAFACARNGQFVAANSKYIHTFNIRAGDAELAESTELGVTGLKPSRIIEGGDRWYVVGGFDRKHYVHAVSRNGAVTKSFAQAPVQFPASLSDRSARRGSLAWNQKSNTLLYTPANPFEVSEYSPDGELKRSRIVDNKFGPVRYNFARDIATPSDEVFSAFLLPSGGLVAQVFRMTETKPGRSVQRSSLVIIDEDLATTEEVPSPEGGTGFLQGVSADGTLYFFAGVPRGLRVMAMKLVTANSGPSRTTAP